MNKTQYFVKKIVILVSLIFTQYTHAQNISVTVVNDVVVLMMSGPTTISDLSTSLNSSNDTLFILSDIGAGTLSLSGSPSGVSVDNSSKITIIDLSTFNTFAGIELLSSSGNSTVTIGSAGIDFRSVNASANQGLAIDLGSGTGVINIDNPIFSKGAGEISINVSKSIIVTAPIRTETGGIFLSANLQPTATSGNFTGIDIAGNITTNSTDGGEIYIEARGGNSGNNNYGVHLHGGKIIKAGGMGFTTVIGTGGASTGSDNYGVLVSQSNSIISASGGTVSVNGLGGGTGTLSANNSGVVIDGSGGIITNSGTDPGATVSVIGAGGDGINENQIGVDIQNEVSSSGGNIYVEGSGGADAGSFTSNIGLLLRGAGVIHAGGSGTITALGTATAVQNSCDAIQLQDTARILSDNGAISITGISTSSSFGVSFTGTNSIATGNNEPLVIITNKANLGPLSAGTGTIAIFADANTDIDLGGADDVATLGLSSSELNQLSCGHLKISDTTQTGSIIISNHIDPLLVTDSIDLNTGSSILFASDTLVIGNRSLNLNCQSIYRNSGYLDASATGSEVALRNNNTLSFPQGLIAGSIYKLSVDGTGGFMLDDSTTISGNLALNNGDLHIGNYKLTINGVISAISADNSLVGGPTSILSIGGNGSTSIGNLYFSPGTDTLHTLILNRTGATGNNPVVKIGQDLAISNTLELTSGKIALDSHTLAFSGTTINGGNASSYVQINGTGGFQRAGGNSILFPIGINPYLPVTLSCASCAGTDFTVLASPGVSDQSNTPILSDVVNATWSILASVNQTADITFQWPASAELIMPHTSLVLGTRLSNLSAWTGLSSGMTINGTDPFDISYSGFSFSSGVTNMFGIGGGSTPLPVHILHLEADCDKVSWQSSNETPGSTYEVLGSKDGNQWSVLGKVTGNNNSSQINSYSFKLGAGNQEHTFYRLRLIANNENALSKIVASDCQKDGDKIYTLYPNPVKDELFISGLADGTLIKLYNAMGTVVYEAVYNGDNGLINMQDMNQGLYILYIDDKSYSILKSN